jgi:uncharacterized protein YndB with AHSA1/START domain
MAGTVNLHRVVAAPPERVFRAFTDPDALVKWMAPHGFTAKVHSMDFREGGGYKMSFTNFSTKNGHSFGGTYNEIKPNQLIKYTDKFDDPNMPGAMNITISFREVICGTELKITQEGIPDAIPVEMCYLGWQQSLDMMMQLVEPTIPDGQ